MSKKITQSLLKNLFEYDSLRGVLIWKAKTSPCIPITIGSIAGCMGTDGYVVIGIYKKNYKAHRLIWMYHYGTIPKILDHINRIKTDNRIENLRPSSYTFNAVNKVKYKNTTSKYKGVHWLSKSKTWRAVINLPNRKTVFLGHFKNEEEAALAYNKKAKELFGDIAVLNSIDKINSK